ncbi:protein NO VEIN domain-containing protein [Mycobacteroides abscessus]|uniref:protein NO VEIN domain-containing protein n=1 Tax=Mycobacteroides abscessus TaxID=36809 RepID=UPI001896942C
MPSAETRLRLWRSCGGPIEEIDQLVDVLVGAELVVLERSSFRLTKTGQNVVTRRKSQGILPLGHSLLRAGYFHDQARTLLDSGVIDSDGNFSCPTRLVRRSCPQLLGILQLWPNVRVQSTIAVPSGLVKELWTVWALLPPPSAGDSEQDAIRKSIGNRGELYSYQYERLRASDESSIVWVARDDQNLGYDIEDRATTPRRRIEVKASGGRDVAFLLSDNEWRRAHENPASYEIQFWGGVDLHRDAADEYTQLRADGYPLSLTDLPRLVSKNVFSAQPTKWRVTQIGEMDLREDE